nr:uncharacterized protein LOC109423491 [Aedes albopictus]
MDRQTDGKRFLEALIRRGITVLGTMIQRLNESELSLKQQIDMISSVYRFVETWESALPATLSPESAHSLIDFSIQNINSPELEPKQNALALVPDGKLTASSVVEIHTPEFELPVAAYDRYQPGQIGICDITHISNIESEFYMIDQSSSGINFADIVQTLQNVDTVLEDLPASSGQVFGVRVDGTILRAVRSKQTDPVFVKLLDTGEILPLDGKAMVLFELPPFYAKLPPFALKCFLDSVEGCSDIDCREYLETNLFSRSGYKIQEVGSSSLKVSLMPSTSVEMPRKTVETRKEQEPYKVSLSTLTQAQVDELYEEPLNTTNVMKAVLGYVPRDDQRICPFYDPAIEGCFKGSRCRLEHVAKLPDGWTRDKSLHKIQIRAELVAPDVGTEMMVIPTFIVNVDEFYAHIPRQDLSKALIELQVQMNDDKIVENFRMLNHEPHFHELVFAKYSEDDLWYRARVVECYNPEVIVVFYVDYGNTAVLSLKDLRCWDDQFDYLPFQAVHCRIANAQRIREDHIEAIRQIYNDIINKPIKIQILDNLSPWEVLLFDDEDNDIGQFLVLTKLALPREPKVMDKSGTNFIPG